MMNTKNNEEKRQNTYWHYACYKINESMMSDVRRRRLTSDIIDSFIL